MKIELSPEDLERILKGLEIAYLRSQDRGDYSYNNLALADRLRKKEPQGETQTEERKRKKG
jgi:hypothetical protein